MYSAAVLDHLENPRNVGEMPDATVRSEATNPVCGDLLQFYLKIKDEIIIASSFQAQACPPCIAAASVLTEIINGLTLEKASLIKAADIRNLLDPLPRNKDHCPVLAIDGLQNAIRKYRQKIN